MKNNVEYKNKIITYSQQGMPTFYKTWVRARHPTIVKVLAVIKKNGAEDDAWSTLTDWRRNFPSGKRREGHRHDHGRGGGVKEYCQKQVDTT